MGLLKSYSPFTQSLQVRFGRCRCGIYTSNKIFCSLDKPTFSLRAWNSQWRWFRALALCLNTLWHKYLGTIDRIVRESNEIDDQLIRNGFKVIDQAYQFLWSSIQDEDQAEVPKFQTLSDTSRKCLSVK